MVKSGVVPCNVGGRAQKWVLKVRKNGLVALVPTKKTLRDMASEMLAEYEKIK